MAPRVTDSPQGWLNAELERIRGRKDLSEAGRKDHIKKAALKAEAASKANREKNESERSARRSQALRVVLGGARSDYDPEYRQLRETALAMKTPKEAANALEMALTVGDHKEAKAIIAAAWNRFDNLPRRDPSAQHWIDVANRGAAEYPSIDQALTELGNLEQSRMDRLDLANTVSVPKELAGDNSWRARPDIAHSDEVTPEARNREAFLEAVFRYPAGPGTVG